MSVLWFILCSVLMVTVVKSKPVCLNEGEDSSRSSESSESTSSEETASNIQPSGDPLQPALTETDMPSEEETSPGDTGDTEPSPASPVLLPDPEDPQTSADTDALLLVPDDPSYTTPGVDIAQDIPDSDPAEDSLNADTVLVLPHTETSVHPGLTETDMLMGTHQPHVTSSAYQGFPQGTTPSYPIFSIKPTPLSFSTDTPYPIPIGTALTPLPICFTLQFDTAEPDPPRGDA